MEELAIIELETDGALARIEDERPVHGQIDGKLVVSGWIDVQGTPDLRLLVERQPIAVLGRLRAVEFRPAVGPLRNEPRDGRHGGRHDRFGGLHVLFQEQRRDRQHVADRVEPVAGVVGRELFLGLEVKTGQVADRVAILDPVEPADGHAAGIEVLGIDPEDVALDPVGQEPHFLVVGPGLPGRRHDAGAHVLEHRPPELALRHQAPRRTRTRRTPSRLSSSRRRDSGSSSRSGSAGSRPGSEPRPGFSAAEARAASAQTIRTADHRRESPKSVRRRYDRKHRVFPGPGVRKAGRCMDGISSLAAGRQSRLRS